MKKRQLLETLRREADSLKQRDEAAIDKWRRRAEMIISNFFGADSRYAKDLAAIDFYPVVYPASEDYERSSFTTGKTEALNLVDTMLEELELFDNVTEAPSRQEDRGTREVTNDVFIVHGHDEAMKA